MSAPAGLAFVGTFEEARAAARRERRWLLVHVHKEEEFKSWTLNRDVWRDEEVAEVRT